MRIGSAMCGTQDKFELNKDAFKGYEEISPVRVFIKITESSGWPSWCNLAIVVPEDWDNLLHDR